MRGGGGGFVDVFGEVFRVLDARGSVAQGCAGVGAWGFGGLCEGEEGAGVVFVVAFVVFVFESGEAAGFLSAEAGWALEELAAVEGIGGFVFGGGGAGG
jgi:hypothetical protein